MDRLTEGKRAEVKKMADARLVSKLLQTGMPLEEVERLDRGGLMNAWAERIIEGREAATAVGAPKIMGDPDLERRRLEFEIRRYEEEKEEKRRLYEAEREEKKRIHEESLNFQREQLRRQEEDLELRRRELMRNEAKDRADRERNESRVMKAKIFGDAIRNSAFRMGNDVIDILPFFENVEHLFRDLEVPHDLRIPLLRPYLNERARVLLTRIDPARATDYDFVKAYLLHQFELCPRIYLEKFNTIVRQGDETMMLFSARLKSLLQYYLSSRHINGDFDQFFSLMIADRMKQTMSEGCLRHVLSVESSTKDGWLGYDKLAEAADIYMSNHLRDVPRVSASGAPAKPVAMGQSRSNLSLKSSAPIHSDNNANNRSMRPVNQIAGVVTSETGGKTCYRCHSNSHLVAACPMRSALASKHLVRTANPPLSGIQGQSNSVRQGARVNHCSAVPVNSTVEGEGNIIATQVKSIDTEAPAKVNACAVVITPRDRVSLENDQRGRSSDCNMHRSADASKCNGVVVGSDIYQVGDYDHIDVSNASCMLEIPSRIARREVADAGNSQPLASLQYIPVKISGIERIIHGLADSGSEICVIHADVMRGITYEPIGRVRLRGIIGDPVEADVTTVTIQLASDSDCVANINCAVCEHINEELILTANVVDQLMYACNRKMINSERVNISTCDVKPFVNTDGDVISARGIVSSELSDTVSVNIVINAHDASHDASVIKGGNQSEVDKRSPEILDVDQTDPMQSDLGRATADELRREQLADDTLNGCWNLAKRGKGGYFVQEGLLYRTEQIMGQKLAQLVVPRGRRNFLLKLAHETYGGHLAMRKTRDRIKLSGLTFPNLTAECKAFTSQCKACQMHARVTCFDRVPIEAIPRADEVFSHFLWIALGRFFQARSMRNIIIFS